jgi:GNAT superfamily N-acetyltransferase
MRAYNLVTLKIELEFGRGPVGDTLPPAAVKAEAHPRLLATRYPDGETMFFRHDVPPETRERLRALGVDRALSDRDAVTEVLSRDAPVLNTWHVCWYTVERRPQDNEFSDVTLHDGRYVVLRDGRIVAQAWDSWTNPDAAEVEVETHPAYRRRGYARQVVAAWAARVRDDGKIAYYSHTVENEGSRALARSLRLTWLSTEVEYL